MGIIKVSHFVSHLRPLKLVNIRNNIPCPESAEETLGPGTAVPDAAIVEVVADTGFPIFFAFTSTLIGHPVRIILN